MHRQLCLASALVLAFSGPVWAQDAKDDFRREGNPKARAKKDPLEGKKAPLLKVENWLNTGGKALKLADLEGKVVVLDFWGVW